MYALIDMSVFIGILTRQLQLIRFARVCRQLLNFSNTNIGIISLEKPFPSSIPDAMVSKIQIALKSILDKGLSEPDFYGDLVDLYKFKTIMGRTDLFYQFRKVIIKS